MPPLKLQTARTLKWNTIDRLLTQLIYALVGVVLANILSRKEFGLVGVLLIFQAFATILVDSGFGAALLREKNPTQKDYSTVFWFNTIVSLLLYALLFLGAPLIARIFQNQQELIPLSKVMFLSFVINGMAIVQVNRLMKEMNVKMIAVSNTIALLAGGIAGIWSALEGYGAWALVWQTVVMAFVKTGILWLTSDWHPAWVFSRRSLRKVRAVGMSVLSSSMLNTISLNVYNFVIGIFYPPAVLGVYTQADKWAKMGSASISQILTGSFVPLLSKVQDSKPDFDRYLEKTLRFTSFILLPSMILLVLIAEPLFHLLFADKWDAAIPLFQILSARGIFIVYISLFSNYLLAMGMARSIFRSEFIKDAMIFLAIAATVFFHNLTLLIIGQGVASVLTWIILIPVTSKPLRLSVGALLRPVLPFLLLTVLMAAATILISAILPAPSSFIPSIRLSAGLDLFIRSFIACITYIAAARIIRLPELDEAAGYLFGRFRKKA